MMCSNFCCVQNLLCEKRESLKHHGYINLAYHGMQSQYEDFHVTFEREYDDQVGNVNLVSQDFGQVLVNLINNAFDAMHEKMAEAMEGYQPKLAVTTNRLENDVIVSITDNGKGVPAQVLAAPGVSWVVRSAAPIVSFP